MGALGAFLTGGIIYWQTGSWRDAMLVTTFVLIVDIYGSVGKLRDKIDAVSKAAPPTTGTPADFGYPDHPVFHQPKK